MTPFFVLRSLFFAPYLWLAIACSFVIQANPASEEPRTKNQEPGTGADEPFRPEAGKFPPLEKAHAYRGEPPRQHPRTGVWNVLPQ
jgi:hypothetical protein